MKSFILSNQVKCKSCGDSIYSMSKHHQVDCSCGAITIDGGMDYLRRLGDSDGYIEQSITLDYDLVMSMIDLAEWAVTTGRNPLGIVCAISRAIRDSGYKIVKDSA